MNLYTELKKIHNCRVVCKVTGVQVNSWGLIADRGRDFFITAMLQTNYRVKPAFFRVDTGATAGN
jgi:hypothetical protein